MQQVFLLTKRGEQASRLIDRIEQILPTKAVGFRMLPFTVAGLERGEMIHFLTDMEDTFENNIPTVLRLSRHETVEMRSVWDGLASRVLNHCVPRMAPIIVDRVTAGALSSHRFMEALAACVAGAMPVITVAEPMQETQLRGYFPGREHLWLNADREDANRLEEQICCELCMRL